MPKVLSDIVDVYVFRRLNARVQFLLLQRKHDVAMPQTWQGFHAQIKPGESTLEAARRAVLEMSGLNVSGIFSADYVNQFYDDYRDALVLAPVIAVNVSPQAPVSLGEDFRDCAWLDRDEATIRLPFSGQRWAVRHIDELLSIGEREAELYRLQMPQDSGADTAPAPRHIDLPLPDDGISVGETYEEVAKPSDPASNDFPILSGMSIFKKRTQQRAVPEQADEPHATTPDETVVEDLSTVAGDTPPEPQGEPAFEKPEGSSDGTPHSLRQDE